MEAADRTLLIVGAGGAVLAAAFGALAASGLRVSAPNRPVDQAVVVGTQEVFSEGAPAYPSWAPEPLYPGTQPSAMDQFTDAWDQAMGKPDEVRPPRDFGPPADLPPPYEVRMQGEARPQDRPADGPRVIRVPAPNNGQYEYGAPARTEPATDDGKPKAAPAQGSSSMSQ